MLYKLCKAFNCDYRKYSELRKGLDQFYHLYSLFLNVGHFKVFIEFVMILFLFYALIFLDLRHVGS